MSSDNGNFFCFDSLYVVYPVFAYMKDIDVSS